MRPSRFTRRRFLGGLAATACTPRALRAQAADIHLRRIPGSGETVPAIGMGTWITFNVGSDPGARRQCAEVLRTFFAQGGRLIDSSPMYGSAEEVVGDLIEPAERQTLFSATKVWTPGRWLGIRQMERSQRLWDVGRFDLMQIHNMLDWQTHLETLKAWKAEGKIRYLGITTSHGRRHDELAQAMTREPFDFVQFSYSLADRSAESRLLPLAAERGMAVIANRPFDGGELFAHVRGRPLPAFAAEIGCRTWAQLFLKFVIAHPAITCAIPATSRPAHMLENMAALRGPLPDAALRRRMTALL